MKHCIYTLVPLTLVLHLFNLANYLPLHAQTPRPQSGSTQTSQIKTLPTLTKAKAQRLIQQKNLTSLKLPRLKTIEVEAARVLASFKGRIYFDEIQELNAEAIGYLGKRPDYISIDKLGHIDNAAARMIISLKRGDLFIQGLERLTEENARILKTATLFPLTFKTLKTLTPSVARELAQFKGKLLNLGGLSSLSAASASELARFSGKKLILDSLKELNAETARNLAQFQGTALYLSGVKNLDAAVIQELTPILDKIRGNKQIRQISKQKKKRKATTKRTSTSSGAVEISVGHTTSTDLRFTGSVMMGTGEVGIGVMETSNQKPAQKPKIKKHQLGTIEFGAIEVNSFCRKSDVMKILQTRKRSMKYCYDKELARKPDLKGQVTLKWTIEITGKVARAGITQSTLKYDPVESCLLKTIKRIRFSKPQGGLCTLSQSLTFKVSEPSKAKVKVIRAKWNKQDGALASFSEFEGISTGMGVTGSCSLSQECTEFGRCSTLNGTCIARKEADCKRSKICKQFGQCSAVAGVCKALKDEDCARSKQCQTLGRCAAIQGRCQAGEESHCLQSEQCKNGMHCSLIQGRCEVESLNDCTQSRICQEEGRCSPGEVMECEATRLEHCINTNACKKNGLCSLDAPFCVPTQPEHCNQSELCKSEGKCFMQIELGFCVKQNYCDQHEDSQDQSKSYSLIAGVCKLKATQPEICAQSKECKSRGDCSVSDGHCSPKNDQDCQQSQVCKDDGQCTAINGMCLATQD